MRMQRLIKLILVMVFVTNAIGCTWLVTRQSGENRGQIFPGTPMATALLLCGVPEGVTSMEGSALVKPIIIPIGTATGVVEIAVSLSLDIALLPIDLLLESKGERKTTIDYCSEMWFQPGKRYL